MESYRGQFRNMDDGEGSGDSMMMKTLDEGEFDRSEKMKQKLENGLGGGEQLTMAEKMMLDHLLEKERNGRSTKKPSGELKTNKGEERSSEVFKFRRNPSRTGVKMAENKWDGGRVKKDEAKIDESKSKGMSEKWSSALSEPPRRSSNRGGKLSREDQSVMRAMEELDQLTDAQLIRMMNECRSEQGGDDESTGDFLAWYMAGSTQFDSNRRSSTATAAGVTAKSAPSVGRSIRGAKTTMRDEIKVGKSMVEEEESTLATAVSSKWTPTTKSVRAESAVATQSKTSQPIRDGSRLIFSFMRDEASTSADRSMPPLMDVGFGGGASSMTGLQKNVAGKPSRARRSEPRTFAYDNDIKMSRTEQRRPPLETLPSEEESEMKVDDDYEDSDQDSKLARAMPDDLFARPSTSKSKSKKKEDELILWDPSKPRPMPRRLRPRQQVRIVPPGAAAAKKTAIAPVLSSIDSRRQTSTFNGGRFGRRGDAISEIDGADESTQAE